MPELPEITSRTRELQAILPGKRFTSFTILQPKSLNLPPEEFEIALTGARVHRVYNNGKWIFIETDRGFLLLNLGMGGEILHCQPDHLPAKVRFVLQLDSGEAIAINFWWFGYIHFVPSGELISHSLTAKLGPNALELTEAEFTRRMSGQRGRVKAFLLDQKNLAGIGNAYIHDILFMARLHPLRPITSLTPTEITALWNSIHKGLQPALDLGGASYEQSVSGQPGGFSMDHILIGYKEGKPCPVCGTPIQKIKTGSTASFICPTCQSLD